MIVHVLRGDSVDPVGDFVAINQELELFNPKLAEKLQVVVVNKIDIPEVRENLDDLTRRLKKAAGHTRVMGISAATGERVKELMQRVRKVVESLPVQSDFELFTEEEERVSFDDQASDKFEVFTDERFPGQFRVVGDKIEKVIGVLLLCVLLFIACMCFTLSSLFFVPSGGGHDELGLLRVRGPVPTHSRCPRHHRGAQGERREGGRSRHDRCVRE